MSGVGVGMVPACRVLIDLDEVGPSEGRSLLGAILLAVTGRTEIMDDGWKNMMKGKKRIRGEEMD